jgi:hypothetical protein
MTAPTTRRVNGAHVFSLKTRRRILSALRDKALAGDAAAAEVILRYGDPAGRQPATDEIAGNGRA